MGKLKHYIYVPKTIEAMYEQEYGKWQPSNHYVWELTETEFSVLWQDGIFDFLNRYFDVMIDEYEDEEIFYQRLYFCKEELFEELSKYKCYSEIEKLKQMVDYAIKTRTLICFVF